MRCQDYFQLKDTALPVVNYLLENGHNYGWEFFTGKQISDTNGIKIVLPDTVINQKSYKRIKIINYPNYRKFEKVFCIDCSAKNSIFYINRTLDEMNPRCKVVRSIERNDNEPFTTVFNTKLISDTLSKEEKAVFLQWAKNASNTNLPLISFDSASKLVMKNLSL